MRKPKDRDFLQTKENLYFCLAGYLHPRNSYTAYLKYSPTSHGKWRNKDHFLRRELPFYHVSKVEKTLEFLKKNHPKYVRFCPVRDIEISMISKKDVREYFYPERRLCEIFSKQTDVLEREVFKFCELILEESGVSLENLGVTGSILLKIHNSKFSDMDILCYGEKNYQRVMKFLTESPIVERPMERRKAWIERRMKNFFLSRREAIFLASKRLNYGFYEGRYFSLHAVKKDEEIKEDWGDRIYGDCGFQEVRATIRDSKESIFLPAIYKIEDVDLNLDVREIVSNEGMYCDVFEKGQRVHVGGKLESVDLKYYRIVIGTTEYWKEEFFRLEG